MRRVVLFGLSALAMAALGACGDGSIGETQGASNVAPQDAAHEFLLEENTESVTRGHFFTASGRVSFWAVSSADAMTIGAQINGKTFDVSIDESTVVLDGHGAVLTADEKALLLSLSEELRSRLPTVATGAVRIETLAALTGYLSEAPRGYVHLRVANGQVLPEGVAAAPANSTRVCLTRGRTYTTSYTAPLTGTVPSGIDPNTNKPRCPNPDSPDVPGSNICTNQAAFVTSTTTSQCTVTKTVVAGENWQASVCGAGNYDCMGLCGAACSGSRYSIDCLKHDMCSHDAASTTGGSDPSCGDEYSNASDDTITFLYKCTSYL